MAKNNQPITASDISITQLNRADTYIGVDQDGCTNIHSVQIPPATPQNVSPKTLGFAKGMVIASLNINSLPLHKDEVSSFINEKGIHVLALNETKVERKMGNTLLNINGYKIEREDRNNRGGGVAIYVKSSINYARRKDIPLDALELVCIEIKPVKASPFIIIAWYRPPSDPILTFDKLEKVLQYLENENKEILLIGDTNCNLLHQEVLQSPNSDLAPAFGSTGTADANTSSGMCKHMIDLYEAYGLKQLIKEPTRVTLHTSTLIDHVAVSDPRNIVDSGVLKIAMSDHYMVYCVRKFRGALTKQHKKITTRQMKNFDETSFLADISSVDWNLIIQRSADLDSAVENWTNLLSLIIEEHAPMRQRRVSDRYCPWLTSELKATMRSRGKLKKSAVKHGSALLMQAYRRIRNRVNSLNTKLK